MSLDESSITGETNLVRKQVPETYEPGEKRHPFLISGSKVMEGTGDIIVCAIGENSQWGQAKKLMKSGKQSKTPLQEKLNELADDIGKIGFRVFNLLYPKMACLTFLAMTAHLVVESYFVGFESLLRFQTLQHLLNFFIVAVTIVVVAVPEGLPLAVTIALAYSVGKMKEENNLVRYLQACETMGGANNICSDKTGTLTKNLMTVTNLFIQEQDITKFDSRL
jgi:Ca2+ transporting ATPase